MLRKQRRVGPTCTQPSLPLGRGYIRTETHDSIGHGTITLFTALNYLDGKLIYRTEQKHTHVEWLRFLKQLDREAPKDLEIHLIADNYSTHKQAKVKAWLACRPRFHMHFTPTSSSWMNLVERFFAEITQDCVRAGSFGSVPQLTRPSRRTWRPATNSRSRTAGKQTGPRFWRRSSGRGKLWCGRPKSKESYCTAH